MWSYEKYLILRARSHLPSSISCNNIGRVLQSVNSGASMHNCHWKKWQRKFARIFAKRHLLALKAECCFSELTLFLKICIFFLLECFAVRGKWVNFVFSGFAVCFDRLWRRDLRFLRYVKYLSDSVLLGLLRMPISRLSWNYWIIFGFCNG